MSFFKKRDLVNVEQFEKYWEELNTSKTSSEPVIMYSKKEIEGFDDFEDWYKKVQKPETFQERLLHMVWEKYPKDSDFYRKAGIDRKLFSAIRNNVDYQPSLETAMRCCFALEMGEDETRDLLKSAGLYISTRNRREAALVFCLKNQIYDILMINVFLTRIGEKTI